MATDASHSSTSDTGIADAFKQARPAVDGLLAQIEPKLQAAVPEIALQLPRLTAEMLQEESTSGMATTYQRLGEEADSKPADVSGMEAGAPRTISTTGASAMAAEAKLAGAMARAGVMAGANPGLGSAGALLERLAASLASRLGVAQGTAEDALGAVAATAASLALALATAVISLLVLGADSVVGPIVNALLGTAVAMAPVANRLKSRVMAIFDAANGQLGRAKRALDDLLDTLNAMILEPLLTVSAKVEEAITGAMAPLSGAKAQLDAKLAGLAALDLEMPDAAALKAPILAAQAKLDELMASADEAVATLTADFKEDLAKISKFESLARRVDPDFDVPDPSDLKTKLDEEVVGPLEAQIAAANQKVDETLGNLAKPFEQVRAARDKLLATAQQLELPSSEGLLAPLVSARTTVEQFAAVAKKEVPARMDQIVAATPTGKAASDEGYFTALCYYLPLAILFCLNAPLGVLTALSSLPTAPSEPLAALSAALAAAPGVGSALDSGAQLLNYSTLQLTSSVPNSTSLLNSTAIPGLPSAATAAEAAAEAASTAAEAAGGATDWLMPFVMPVFMQLVLVVLQLVLTHLATCKRAVLAVVNGAIGRIESKLNERINGRVTSAIDDAFGAAMPAVRAQLDDLVATAKAGISKGEAAVEMAMDVTRLTEAAHAAQAKVEGAAAEGAQQVQARVEEGQTQLGTAREDMEARIKKAAAAADALDGSSFGSKVASLF